MPMPAVLGTIAQQGQAAGGGGGGGGLSAPTSVSIGSSSSGNYNNAVSVEEVSSASFSAMDIAASGFSSGEAESSSTKCPKDHIVVLPAGVLRNIELVSKDVDRLKLLAVLMIW